MIKSLLQILKAPATGGTYDRALMHYIVEPEVAGGLGPGTVLDRSVHPPRVSKLHYRFEGWMGDQIVESFPCFVVTEELAERFKDSSLTGMDTDQLEVSVSEQFAQQSRHDDLPAFVWFKVNGAAGKDDFGLASDGRLVVSDKALQVIRSTHPKGLQVTSF